MSDSSGFGNPSVGVASTSQANPSSPFPTATPELASTQDRAAYKAARLERKQARDLKRQRKRSKEASRRSSQFAPPLASPATGPDTPLEPPSPHNKLHTDGPSQEESEEEEGDELPPRKKQKKVDKETGVVEEVVAPVVDEPEVEEGMAVEHLEPPSPGQANQNDPNPAAPSTTGEPETEEEANIQDFLVPPSTKKANKIKYSAKNKTPTKATNATQSADDEPSQPTPSRSLAAPAPTPTASTSEASPEQRKKDRKARKARKKADRAATVAAQAGADPADVPPTSQATRSRQSFIDGLTGLDTRTVLSTKWLSVKEAEEFARDHNGFIRKGVFTTAENSRLQFGIKKYAAIHGLSQAELETITLVRRNPESSSRKQKLSHDQLALMNRTKDFWAFVTGFAPGRPVMAVYSHLRRLCSPDHRKGTWTKDEDDLLRAAVANLGSQWEQIGAEVGRIAGDCKDRWTKVLEPAKSKEFSKGPWTEEEETLLQQLVNNHGTSWNVVSRHIGTRSSQQCKDKWRTLETKLQRPPTPSLPIRRGFLREHRPLLVQAIAAQDVNSADEIDFAEINAPQLARFKVHSLRKYWNSLVHRANTKGQVHEFHAVMAWLHVVYECGAYGKAPAVVKVDPKRESLTPTKGKRKEASVRSKAVVEDSSAEEESEDEVEEEEEEEAGQGVAASGDEEVEDEVEEIEDESEAAEVEDEVEDEEEDSD